MKLDFQSYAFKIFYIYKILYYSYDLNECCHHKNSKNNTIYQKKVLNGI